MQAGPIKKLGAVELQRLSERSNAKGLCHLALHCFALFTCGWFQTRANFGTWSFAALTFLQGVLLSHLYMPFHESCHYTAFRSRLLCEAVATITGFVAGFNATEFRFGFVWPQISVNNFLDQGGGSAVLRKALSKLGYAYHSTKANVPHVNALPGTSTRFITNTRTVPTTRSFPGQTSQTSTICSNCWAGKC